MKPKIPYSYFILYAKGWLRFPDSKSFVKDMQTLVEWEYWSKPENPTGFVINVFEQIKRFFKEHNINLPEYWDSWSYFYDEAKRTEYKDIDNVPALDIAFMQIIYGIFQGLDRTILDKFSIDYIDYEKMNVIPLNNENLSFKEMQSGFEATWKDNFGKYSYDKSKICHYEN